MKSKSLFAKIAVTAMAVAALGSPVAAFAAAGPALAEKYALSQAPLSQSSAKLTAGVAAKAISQTAIMQLPDPSEVAAKYAPDTVEEWKKTLASYNKLAPVKTLSLSAATLPASGSVEAAQPAAAVTIRQGSLTETGSISLQLVKPGEGGIVTAPSTLTAVAGGQDRDGGCGACRRRHYRRPNRAGPSRRIGRCGEDRAGARQAAGAIQIGHRGAAAGEVRQGDRKRLEDV
ncbi:hypothetical protein [Cohnella rhizosphaerae]|uniref:Uncharacterized protein n=1 Tax=Cohnella rhizosphaerae TaxID=1457232 RepID=A0A9X4QSX5_9BACL|nr:hypothetical protein [Cohnella rhizosphaerae]MDG0809773.1 hypothetical protein [Cohnella rhizosphaerae]